MPATPITAMCRRCTERFHLFELRDHMTGLCPRCGWILTPDWSAKLLEDAAVAEIAQRYLISALRNLRTLPGNVAVQPHSVMKNLFEEVGWQRDLIDDQDMLRDELKQLRALLAQWEGLVAETASAEPRRRWWRRTPRVPEIATHSGTRCVSVSGAVSGVGGEGSEDFSEGLVEAGDALVL
jgi:hypothetical protein